MNRTEDRRYEHGHPLEDYIPGWSCGAFYYASFITLPDGFSVVTVPIDRVWVRREDCPEHR